MTHDENVAAAMHRHNLTERQAEDLVDDMERVDKKRGERGFPTNGGPVIDPPGRFRSTHSRARLVHVIHPTKGPQRVFNDAQYAAGQLLTTAACGEAIWDAVPVDEEPSCPACKGWLSRQGSPP